MRNNILIITSTATMMRQKYQSNNKRRFGSNFVAKMYLTVEAECYKP